MANGVQKFYSHLDIQGQEIRNYSNEKLAALPASPGFQGRVVQVGNKLFYADTATSWQQLLTLSQFATRPRLVGGLNVSSGVISLVTPQADDDGTTTWSQGDYGIVTVGGVLAPAPGGGNATVQAGDLIFMTAATAASNASFIVVESNQAQSAALVGVFTDIVTANWTGSAGNWTVSKTTTVAPSNVPYGVTIINATDNSVEYFDVVVTAGTIKLTATTAAAPTATYKVRASV